MIKRQKTLPTSSALKRFIDKIDCLNVANNQPRKNMLIPLLS